MKKITKQMITVMSGIAMAVVVLGGITATMYMTTKIEQDERSNLLLRSEIVASLLDRTALLALRATSSDMTTPQYAKLKTNLEQVNKTNGDTRFVYIIRQIDQKQFFLVDAETTTSPYFSPSGQAYTDATELDIKNYNLGIPYTKGPYTDTWGTWFTAYAPVRDSSGTVIATLGMDIEAAKVLLRISIVQTGTILIFSLLFLSVFVIILLARERSEWSELPTDKS
jgi:hypothetical protein